ncbi:MAG TPA: hypothetical protein VN203_28790 [Candidatus Acidoferrum sp.]|nr:hypothetical protein [Candidatus Acidoferrum sp.]
MEAKQKRTYQKQTIEQITLLGEETTVAGCKQDTGGGKYVSIGTPCQIPKCKFSLGS